MKNIIDIYNLIDGNLKESDEIEIFNQLSTNKELREEFKNANSLNNILKENRDLFLVPKGSKASIFNTIGLSLENPSQSFITSKTFVGIASSLLTILVLFGSFYLSNILENENRNTDSNATSLTNRFLTSIDLPLKKEEHINKISNKNDNTGIFSKRNFVSNKTFQKQNGIIPQNFVSDNIIEETNVNQEQLYVSELFQIKDFFQKPFKMSAETLAYQQTINPDSENKFYFEWSSSVNRNIPLESISPSSLQIFNNNNIAIYYALSDNIDLGFEFRQENFFQKYEDNLKLYEQTPNFTTYSIALKHNFLKNFVIDGLTNYSKIESGLNKGGFVLRTALGAQYELYNGFYLNTNFEYSNLFFSNKYDNFNAHKITLNYGIRYDF